MLFYFYLKKRETKLLRVSYSLILLNSSSIHIELSVSRILICGCSTIQSLGIKVDAVPGRINQLNLFSIRPGLFFGQCSEICGINHRFIPIILERTDYYNFIN